MCQGVRKANKNLRKNLRNIDLFLLMLISFISDAVKLYKKEILKLESYEVQRHVVLKRVGDFRGKLYELLYIYYMFNNYIIYDQIAYCIY